MRRLTLYITFFICVCTCASEPLECFLNHPIIKTANVSVLVQRMSDGKTIASFRPDNIVPPASVMKVLTTATALEHWGENYRFTTLLQYSGTIKNGTLMGNLYIVGQGDPTLGGSSWGSNVFLYDWVQVIKKAGIQHINGQVIADCSYYDGDATNPGWIYEDIGNYYASSIFALAYMDNTMNIQLRSGAINTIAEVIKTTPAIPNLQFENHIRCTAIDYDGAYVHGLPYLNCRYLTGSIPANHGVFGIKGDIPNPGLLLAQDLTKQLRLNQIDVHGDANYVAESDGSKRTLLYTHYSPILGNIVEKTNQHSINLNAEMIFRNLGAEHSLPSTIHHSTEYIQQFWSNRGIDMYTSRILDGCGLSPQNGLSANNLVSLLRYMALSANKDSFIRSLPVSGKTGTLKAFLDKTELDGRVHAKSGTIKGTRNYAGYIDMPNGDQLVFAILVNSSYGNSNQIMTVIEKYLLDVYRANK